jgi:hypothetical protein
MTIVLTEALPMTDLSLPYAIKGIGRARRLLLISQIIVITVSSTY